MIPEYEVRFTIKLPSDNAIKYFRSSPVGKSLLLHIPIQKFFSKPLLPSLLHR